MKHINAKGEVFQQISVRIRENVYLLAKEESVPISEAAEQGVIAALRARGVERSEGEIIREIYWGRKGPPVLQSPTEKGGDSQNEETGICMSHHADPPPLQRLHQSGRQLLVWVGLWGRPGVYDPCIEEGVTLNNFSFFSGG